MTKPLTAAKRERMFQAWSVSTLTQDYFGVPSLLTGVVLAVMVGMVIIGGIKRIGAVAGKLVPFMVATYLIADGSAYVNGEVVAIDGGEWLRGAAQFALMEQLSEEEWAAMNPKAKGGG